MMDVPLDLRVVAGKPRLYWNDEVIIDVSQPLFEDPHLPFDVMLKRMSISPQMATDVMRSFEIQITRPVECYFPAAHLRFLESIKSELHPAARRFLEGGRLKDCEAVIRYTITPHVAYITGHDVRHFTFASRSVSEQCRLHEAPQVLMQEAIGARSRRLVSPIERWANQLFLHDVPPDTVLLDMSMVEFKETVFNRYRIWTDSSYWEKERARFLAQRGDLHSALFDSNVPHFSERDRLMPLHWQLVVKKHQRAVEKYLNMDNLLRVVTSCNRFRYITGVELKINPPPKDFVELTEGYWEETISYFRALGSRIELSVETRNYITVVSRIPDRIATILNSKLLQLVEQTMPTMVQFYEPVIDILTTMCQTKLTYQEKVKLKIGEDGAVDFPLDENVEYAFGVWRSFVLDPIRRYNSRLLARFAPTLPKIELDSPVTLDDSPTGCILPQIPDIFKSRARLRLPSFDVDFLEKTSPIDLLLQTRKVLNDVFNGSDKINYREYKKFKELLSCTVYDQILASGENTITARRMVSGYLNCLDIPLEEVASRLKLAQNNLMVPFWEYLDTSYDMIHLTSDLFQVRPYGIEALYPKWRKRLASLRGSQQRSGLKLTTIDDAYFKSIKPLDEEETFQPNLDVYLKFEEPVEVPGVAARRVHALLHSVYLWDALCQAREIRITQPDDFRVYAFTVRELGSHSLSQITEYFKKKIRKLAKPSHPLHKYWRIERFSIAPPPHRQLPNIAVRLDWPFADKGSVALALCLHEDYPKYKSYAKRRVKIVNPKGLSFFNDFLTSRIKSIVSEDATSVLNSLVDILQAAVKNFEGENAFVFCMPFVHVIFWLHEKTYLASLKFPQRGVGTMLKTIYFSWLDRKRDVGLDVPSFGVEHPLICPYFVWP